MKAAFFACCLLAAAAFPAAAADVAKTYSYFSIRGTTLEDIERDLARRGPNVAATGQRHPGATRMEFKTRLHYADRGRYCEISRVRVHMAAKVILPRWNPSRKASADTRFVWGTLAADIKRHEEQHVIIAKNHARELETALKAIGHQKNCRIASDKAAKVTEKILGKHDREQQRFDRIESAGFEKRFFRLMEYRLKQTRKG